MSHAIVVAMTCAGLSSCGHSTRVVYKDAWVTVMENSTINYINVHASRQEMALRIFGKTYSEVRGQAPYYLELPSKDSILFVTGRDFDHGQATVHVVNLKTQKEISFFAFDSHIGSNIRTNEDVAQFEWIEDITGDRVTIAAGSLDRRYHYYLDLPKPEFEKEDGFEPPHSVLEKTNIYSWPNGKSPKM